jgi:hypothetical protein
MFQYDRGQLDGMLLTFGRSRRPEITRLEDLENGPGFSALDLVGGNPVHGGSAGPVTIQITALVYWLFTNPKPITLPEGAFPKLLDVGRIRFYADEKETCLRIGHQNQQILASIPRLPDVLLGLRLGGFGESREAVHEAAVALTDRVNLIWPAVRTLLAAGNGS